MNLAGALTLARDRCMNLPPSADGSENKSRNKGGNTTENQISENIFFVIIVIQNINSVVIRVKILMEAICLNGNRYR
jgi:hypothetical protein